MIGPLGKAHVHVVEGYVNGVNNDGTKIGVSPRLGDPGEGYRIGDADWRQSGQSWNDTHPTCLGPLTSGQRVRLGLVDVALSENAAGRTMVVWLECPS